MDEIIDNKRYRNWMILFYEDSETYNFDDIIFNIKSCKYYAYIKHSPEDNEFKPHYHAFITLDSACTLSAISKRIGVPEQFIKYVKSVRGAVRYLTHVDYPDKIQYLPSDITCSGLFQRKMLKHFEDLKTDEEILQDIYRWIDESSFPDYFEKLKYFLMYVNSNVYDSIYKRYRYEINEYLKHSI